MKLSSVLLSATTLYTTTSTTSAFTLFHPSSSSSSSTVATTQSTTTAPPSSSATTTTSLFAVRRGGRPRGPVRTIEIKPTMNNEITYSELRVSIPNFSPTSKNSNKQPKDEQLGIMSLNDALAKAKELGGLDVVLINENSDPPVAKIVDYSKFRYEKEKKAKELKKNSKATEIKEVKMSYKIDVHDYGVRIKNASKFISQGNRVKCTVMFKGREVQHDNLGFDLLNRMAEDMTKICTMEGKPKREGRNLSCILSPRPEVTKAVNDKKRADERAKKKNKNLEKEARMKKDDDDDNNDEIVGSMKNEDNDDNNDDDEDGDLGSLDDLLGDDGSDDLFN